VWLAGWEQSKLLGKSSLFGTESFIYDNRPQSKRSLASRTPFGLKPNWQSTRSIQSPANVLQGSQDQAATLDPESDSDSNTPTPSRPSTFSHMHSRAAMTEPDDTPAYSYGGFMPESTELERFELEGGKNVSESLKYKVRPTTAHKPHLNPASLRFSLSRRFRKSMLPHPHTSPIGACRCRRKDSYHMITSLPL
jgi:hypothetical protein